ncbi:hypothetical protein QE152_g23141 [Popillia japonica]|uniref:Uncharacterized protein n=1 Tax=Popillia japonica TaxID=7064 RepID=A0AAW1KI88_POPJA
MATHNNLTTILILKTLICVGLFIKIGECNHQETNSNQPSTTPRGISETEYEFLFGGLLNSDLGRHLSQHINKIDSGLNLPAYSVYHYWYSNGYTPISTVEGSTIGACSDNSLLICLPGTIPMCITNGITHCVLPQYLTVPCEDLAKRSCVISFIRRTECVEDWKCVNSAASLKRISIPCMNNIRVLFRTSPSRFNRQFYILDLDRWNDSNNVQSAIKNDSVESIASKPSKQQNWFYSGEFCVYISAVPTKSYKNIDFVRKLNKSNENSSTIVDELLEVMGNYILS